jgi:polysaccharide deacetylase family protein (PEP-CTERM system associated)
MLNVLSVDVEEYFHPAEVAGCAPEERWSEFPSRVDYQVRQVLDLLDQHSVKATFFILGWVAEQHPRTIQAIVAAGHEIGCHSYSHRLVYRLDPAEFRRDTLRAIRAIEDSCGVTPRSYRAPSYSVTRGSLWALEILVQCGFVYDSSIYPIAHDRYGIPGSSRHSYTIETPSGPILELPIATVALSATQVIPVGGGGYLRLLPYRYTAAGIRRVNQDEQQPACIYFHPWEIDTEQPRLARGIVSQLRTYSGIKGMQRKLDRLCTDFRFSTVSETYGLSFPASAKPAGSPTAGLAFRAG